MSQGNDLWPPQDADVELETIGFDFGDTLEAGEQITSVIALTCEVASGTDPAPSSRVVGPSFIVTSTTTGAANGQVNQNIGALLGYTIYLLQCVVMTSLGQKLSLWMHWQCEQ